MREFNLIVIFNKPMNKSLFCIRAKDPYKGLYNFVGGKVEESESNDDAAYRELFEETGISKDDIKLDHFMDIAYFKYGNNLQVYYGILEKDVTLVEEKNKLEWVSIDDESVLLDNKFAGNYNIPHIIRQIKQYIEYGTDIRKY
ncbi:MAG: NUDIX hydrolase [Clostridia bacterium]|nr:NUDIX hydrolase [Clostridia bacterium]